MTAKKTRAKKTRATRARAKKPGKKQAKKKAASRAAPKKRARRTHGVDIPLVREVALSLPEVEEAPSYGTPGFRVKRKLFARIHQGGDDLVLRSDFDTKEALLAGDPTVFHETDHYRGHPWLLMRLAAANRATLEHALRDAWTHAAPPRLVRSLEDG